EGVVLDHDGAVEHGLLFPEGLQPLVSLRPDALSVVNLAESVAGTPARAVSLVLGALRFGAHVCDLRERAVAAVLAAEERHLRCLLDRMRRSLHGPGCLLDAAVEGSRGREERRLVREHRV